MPVVICESCGMPMKEAKDFGGQILNNKYCLYCTYDDGSLKSWEDQVNSTAQFIVDATDVNLEKAKHQARENLKIFPAWKDIK